VRPSSKAGLGHLSWNNSGGFATLSMIMMPAKRYYLLFSMFLFLIFYVATMVWKASNVLNLPWFGWIQSLSGVIYYDSVVFSTFCGRGGKNVKGLKKEVQIS
jgi:hypothetical protein